MENYFKLGPRLFIGVDEGTSLATVEIELLHAMLSSAQTDALVRQLFNENPLVVGFGIGGFGGVHMPTADRNVALRVARLQCVVGSIFVDFAKLKAV